MAVRRASGSEIHWAARKECSLAPRWDRLSEVQKGLWSAFPWVLRKAFLWV